MRPLLRVGWRHTKVKAQGGGRPRQGWGACARAHSCRSMPWLRGGTTSARPRWWGPWACPRPSACAAHAHAHAPGFWPLVLLWRRSVPLSLTLPRVDAGPWHGGRGAQVVHSRTFGSAAKGGGVGVRMLVPLVDMLNHSGDIVQLGGPGLCGERAGTDNVRCARACVRVWMWGGGQASAPGVGAAKECHDPLGMPLPHPHLFQVAGRHLQWLWGGGAGRGEGGGWPSAPSVPVPVRSCRSPYTHTTKPYAPGLTPPPPNIVAARFELAIAGL